MDKNYLPDLSQLKNTCFEIKKFIKSGQIICVKSTIPTGITRNLIHKILGKEKNIDLAFCPERFSEGTAIKEFKSLPIVVGGISDKAASKVANFWLKVMNVKIIKVKNAETAEFVKLATNAWIDLNIGYVNDLARLVDQLNTNIDILDVVAASNTLKKGKNFVNILLPSIGVGGYCLTKDPWFVYSLGKKNNIDLQTIKAGRIANDLMPRFAANKIYEYLDKKKIDYQNAKIAILGLSFKSDSGDIRFTPVIPFIKDLIDNGIKNIKIYDPLVTKEDQKKIRIKTFKSSYEVIKESDCIIIAAAHKQIKKLNIEYFAKLSKNGALILDGRRYFSKQEIIQIEKKGFVYKGIGR